MRLKSCTMKVWRLQKPNDSAWDLSRTESISEEMFAKTPNWRILQRERARRQYATAGSGRTINHNDTSALSDRWPADDNATAPINCQQLSHAAKTPVSNVTLTFSPSTDFSHLHSTVRLNSLSYTPDYTETEIALELEVKCMKARRVNWWLPSVRSDLLKCHLVSARAIPSEWVSEWAYVCVCPQVRTRASLLTLPSPLCRRLYPLALKIGRELLNEPHHCCRSEPPPKDE